MVESTTMHVMLSELPREKAVSANFRAAASGSSSILTSAMASWKMSMVYEKRYTVIEQMKIE